MAIDPQIANPAALGYAQNALINRQNQQQQGFVNNLAMRDQGLQEQAFQAQQNALTKQQGLAQSKMTAEQALAGSRILQREMQNGADPMQLIPHVAPDLQAGFEQQNGPGSFSRLSKDQILQIAKQVELKAMQQLGMQPEVQYEKTEGPRGSIMKRRVDTGDLEQVIGPDNTQERPQPTGLTPYQQAQLDLQERRLAVAESRAGGGEQKPLPVGALRIIDDAKQSLSATKESLGLVDRAIQTLNSGKVQLGMVSNATARVRNKLGSSSEASRAFTDINQTLEKLRNNYLLLAKGVQTEGDATRAWNSEIGESVQNDNKLANQQLQKAKQMITNMAAMQEDRIDTVYSNYGSQRPEQQPTRGQPAGGWTVRRK